MLSFDGESKETSVSGSMESAAQQALDRLQILDLYGQYAIAYDDGDKVSLCELFTEDAVFEVAGNVADMVNAARGAAAIAALLVERQQALLPNRRRHLVTNVVFGSVASDDAQATAALVLLNVRDGRSSLHATGNYVDWFSRGADRRWRFASRTVSLDGPLPPAGV